MSITRFFNHHCISGKFVRGGKKNPTRPGQVMMVTRQRRMIVSGHDAAITSHGYSIAPGYYTNGIYLSDGIEHVVRGYDVASHVGVYRNQPYPTYITFADRLKRFSPLIDRMYQKTIKRPYMAFKMRLRGR